MDRHNQQLAVERYAKGREDQLIEIYILEGPAKLKEELGLTEDEWMAVFDYLVFEANLLYKTVVSNTEFFINEYVRHGMAHLRELLGVLEDKYDKAWTVVFDFLAISNEALYFHVLHHSKRYLEVFRKHGSDFIRRILGVKDDKYQGNWQKVLDFLLNAACEHMFTANTFDHGLKAFSLLMNQTRDHRPIFKSGLLI